MNKGAMLTVTIVISALMLSFIAFPLSASAQAPDFIPGRYIVVLDDGISPQDVIRGHGLVPDFVYSHALNGFSAPISPKLLNELKQDPRVVHIEQDQKVYAFSQTLPTGIDRIDAEPASSPSSFAGLVTIAIIDTGIDFDHPDLNVVHRANCAKKGPMNNQCFPNEGDDGNGHGTHVAGTVAAKDNTDGVVGVVPGADLWAVKVLGNDGSGWMSWIIAGVDYVTANAASVDVANMSLGCECSSGALDTAISNSVAAGVTYAVAAGNSAKDASTFSPANHDDVITVSAIADSDGKCGGLGGGTSYGADDTLASFSNFGDKVEIAAPGVSIYSTYKDGGYATYSGTSMASPHAAGAAAKFIAESTITPTPSDVLTGLLANAVDQTQSCDITKGNGFGGFSENTNDGSPEPLVYVGNTSVGDSPIVSITSPTDGSEMSGSVSITADASDLDGSVVRVEFFVDNTSVGVDSNGADGWSTSWDSTTASEGTHSISATATDNEANTSSDSISVIVDNVDDPPTVSITNPNNGDTVSGSVTITANASDDNGVNQVEFFVDITSIGTDSNGADGWSMSWDTTTVSDADYTLTAKATDSASQTGTSDLVSVTVSNTSPTTATTVSVDSITYTTNGGKEGIKHLNVAIHVIDDLGALVGGAFVSITLQNIDTGGSWSGTATTDSDGNVTFSLKSAPSGCYTTDITDVTANGLTWDNTTPTNEFCK